MFKRFTCMILSFVLLLALVPAGAIEVSAAANATSGNAITILKKLEKFVDHCDTNGFIGYGTKCTEKGAHGVETKAHYHGYGYDCEWDSTVGTDGAYVVKSVDFNMPAKSDNQAKKDYLNSQYKSTYRELSNNMTALNFVLNNWGSMIGQTCPIDLVHTGYTHTIRETEADAALKAAVQKIDTAINSFATSNGLALTQYQHDALAIFSFENGTQWMNGTDDLRTAVLNGTSGSKFETVLTNWKSSDSNARRKVEANMYLYGKYDSNGSALVHPTASTSSSGNWVDVTVTNAYINVREKANIFSTQVGTVYSGQTLHISGTEQNGIWLWGRVVSDKGEELGYVALMYTNYDDVVAASKNTTTAAPVATGKAVVNVNGYVNVRNGAGTHNAIISSLRNNAEVPLYAVQYVNGIAWGQTDVGWFSLSYARNIVYPTAYETNSYGYVNYNFVVRLNDVTYIRIDPPAANGGMANHSKHTLANGNTVRVIRLVSGNDGNTWGQIEDARITNGYGWVRMDTTDLVESKTFTTIREVSVRQYADAGSTLLQYLKAGTEFDISAVYATEDTVWGFAEKAGDLKYDGWINLSTLNVTRKGATVTAATSNDSTVVTLGEVVNCVEVRVRNKANIFGTEIGQLPAGTIVEISEGPVNGTRMTGWYLLNINPGDGVQSWVRGDYLNIYDGPRSSVNYGIKSSDIKSPDGQSAATGRGMVANTYGGVNVRTAPGTANTLVTKLLPGTEVTILEVRLHGSTKWGRIEQGWVSMDYIAMMDYDELPTVTTQTASTQAVYTGHTTGLVKVYKDTKVIDTNYVRDLNNGDSITVYELLSVKEVTYDDGETTTTNTFYWARINDGYILSTAAFELDALNEAEYTVTGADMLKVREWGDPEATREDIDLNKGDVIKVTEVMVNKDQIWGKIENSKLSGGEGWTCLNYCTKGAIAASTNDNAGAGAGDASGNASGNGGATVAPSTQSIGNTGACNYAGKIIGKYEEVTVRKDATTSSDEVTKLKKGTAITITETRLVDGTSWGYCGSGWVALLYVDLTPVGITAIDAKVIGNEGAVVYESSNTGAMAVGSYVRRAVVNIYEEVNGMYKTDMGWISKANVL